MNIELHQRIDDFLHRPVKEGWCETDKAVAMADLILYEKPNVVVEIGVFGGRSLVPQAMACQMNGKGMVYGMDAWLKEVAIEGDNSPQNDDWWSSLDMDYIFKHCFQNIMNYGVNDYAVIIRAPSQNCVQLFNSIDILHIDGAHSEVASVRDVVNYMPKVKPGGFIWFDDVDWETTKKAVAMVEQFCERVDMVGTCALYRKHV